MRSLEKREKFIRLAESRVTKAIKQLRLIGNLSHKGNYEYTDEDVRKIVNALNAEIKAVRGKFENGAAEDGIAFKL